MERKNNRAGVMARSVITLITPASKIKNGYGELVDSGNDVEKDIKCYIKSSTGHKTVNNDEVFNTNFLNIKVRNQHNITYSNKFKYMDKLYIVDNIEISYNKMFSYVNLKRVNN